MPKHQPRLEKPLQMLDHPMAPNPSVQIFD
jgi:hypothetical protein